MSLPILTLAHALTNFAPLIAQWIKGEDGEKVAHKEPVGKVL